MTDRDDHGLDLLLFSVCGVHFGVDAEQVATIAEFDGERSDDLFWFHEELGFGDAAATYVSPTVVTVRTGGVPSYRVIIDAMEDIAESCRNAILPFPELLEPYTLRNGLWGILLRNGRTVLLVDFQRLIRGRRPDTN